MSTPLSSRLFRFILILSFFLSFAALVYLATQKEKPAPDFPEPVRAPESITPELRMQMQAAQTGQGTAAPTPEQSEEEARVEKEQVETATTWLKDPNPEQRVAGAEQLSAYPTPEAEQHLAAALRDDLAPEVRAAAAQSLDFFEKLQDSTVRTLRDALEDPDENVRLNALSTLERQYYHLESDSKPATRKFLAGLKKKAKSPQVPVDTRDAIMDFLQDVE